MGVGGRGGRGGGGSVGEAPNHKAQDEEAAAQQGVARQRAGGGAPGLRGGAGEVGVVVGVLLQTLKSPAGRGGGLRGLQVQGRGTGRVPHRGVFTVLQLEPAEPAQNRA